MEFLGILLFVLRCSVLMTCARGDQLLSFRDGHLIPLLGNP